MKKNFFLSIILLSMVLCVMVGCNKYNAELYDHAVEWIREDFLLDHPTAGAFDGNDSRYDNSFPATRYFIINNNEELREIFNAAFDLKVDFEKEMLIVYTFTTVYHRANKITKIQADDHILKINYKMPSRIGVGDASLPYQRWFVVKLDKLSVTSVEFKEID